MVGKVINELCESSSCMLKLFCSHTSLIAENVMTNWEFGISIMKRVPGMDLRDKEDHFELLKLCIWLLPVLISKQTNSLQLPNLYLVCVL